MIRLCAHNSHGYNNVIQTQGIVRMPPNEDFITSNHPGTHDIGMATFRLVDQKRVIYSGRLVDQPLGRPNG
jgi:hypothetical protein